MAPTDDKLDYLHRGLNELLFFELFTAGEAVDRREEIELHQRLNQIIRDAAHARTRGDHRRAWRRQRGGQLTRPTSGAHPNAMQLRFRHDLRVRYGETDAQAVVYHPNYLVYCDAARVEWFRALDGGGTPWPKDGERDYDIVLVHAQLDFRGSARFDEALTIWMQLDQIGTSSFTFVYRIERAGTVLCEAKTVHVAIERVARTKRPLPASFKQRLRSFADSLLRP